MGVSEKDALSQLSLPPGFRFYPTDEELLVQYLCRKVAGHQFSLRVIADIDLYKFDPWDLPSKALFGEKEWYFFSPRDRKYPNGSRPNRVAGSGYWKATGTDKFITAEGHRVGVKKALVFYVGKAPKGTKTNWIMHEYRLVEASRTNRSSKLDDWSLCRIYKKTSGSQNLVPGPTCREEYSTNGSSSSSSSPLNDVHDSLKEIIDPVFNLPRMNSLKSGLNDDGIENLEWATLAGLNLVSELGPSHGGYNSFIKAETGETQSGSRNQPVNQSPEWGFRQQSSGRLTQGSGFSWGGSGFNRAESVGFEFPGGFGV